MIEETMFNSEDKFSMNGARGDVVRRQGEQRAINSILKLVARLLSSLETSRFQRWFNVLFKAKQVVTF